MSIENAEKLLKALKSNDDLKNQFKNAGDSGFEKVAKKAGYDCTAHEFAEALKAGIAKTDLARQASGLAAAGVVSSAVSSLI